MTRTAIVVSAYTLVLGLASPALAQGGPARNAYFGETHVHTSWSLDAWLFGDRMADPADASSEPTHAASWSHDRNPA